MRPTLQPHATNPATPYDQSCNHMRLILQPHVKVFGYDWLNAWVAPDDYKFCYCGPQDSWTPLHFDVLCSYSWSANVVGTKR